MPKKGININLDVANMQANLFDDDNYYRNSYKKSLMAFKIDTAINILKKWNNTFSPPANIDKKINSLQNLLNENLNDLHSLATIYAHLESIKYLQPLKDDLRSLRRGLTTLLSSKISIDMYDFIIPELHPAEIFINMEDFASASHSCSQYIQHIGENPLIRQLEAVSFYQRGESNSAAIATTYAIFNNVLQCKVKFLCPSSFRKKYDFLLESSGREEVAMLRLPFALWQDGKTYIVPNDDKFDMFLRKSIIDEQKVKNKSKEEKVIYFYHLLYLVEMIRLRSARKHVSQEVIDLRLEMKKTDDVMFSLYMNAISHLF